VETNRHIALEFLSQINSHNLDGMIALLSDDAVYINPFGEEIADPFVVKYAWNRHFDSYPDFFVEVEQVIESGNYVAVFGQSISTPGLVEGAENKVPTAWRVRIEFGKVSSWQVFTLQEQAVWA